MIDRKSNISDVTGLPQSKSNDREQLECFDKLPKELKDTIRDLPFRVSCVEILHNHKIGVPIKRQIAGIRTFANKCSWTVWKNQFNEEIANDLWERSRLTPPRQSVR